MPLSSLNLSPIVVGTESESLRVLSRRSVLGRGARAIVPTSSAVGPSVRRRTPNGGANAASGVDISLRWTLLQRVSVQQMAVGTRSLVNSFLNAIPLPAPQGRLLNQTLGEFENPSQDSIPFSGRYLRGETIPLKCTMRGVRIADLRPIFTACKVGDPIAAHEIIKQSPGGIRLGANSIDSRTRVEERSFNFSIESSDTLSLMDGEHEYEWLLVVEDGNGRRHMLDSGKFKIYSYC